MQNGYLVVFSVAVTALCIATVCGTFIVRKGVIEEKRTDARTFLLNVVQGFYLAGIPLSLWLKKAIARKGVMYAVADYTVQISEIVAHQLYQNGAAVLLFTQPRTGGGNTYQDVIIRFHYEGEWWQFAVLEQYGIDDELPYITHVSKTSAKSGKDVRGYDTIDALSSNWQKYWDLCRDEEKSKEILPTTVRDIVFLNPQFDWESKKNYVCDGLKKYTTR